MTSVYRAWDRDTVYPRLVQVQQALRKNEAEREALLSLKQGCEAWLQFHGLPPSPPDTAFAGERPDEHAHLGNSTVSDALVLQSPSTSLLTEKAPTDPGESPPVACESPMGVGPTRAESTPILPRALGRV